jgi:hypothetical protein
MPVSMLVHHVTQWLFALLWPVLLDEPDLVDVDRHQRSHGDCDPAAFLVYARDLAGKLDLLPLLDLGMIIECGKL